MQQTKQEILEIKHALDQQQLFLLKQLHVINKKLREEREAKTPVHLIEKLEKVRDKIKKLEERNENIIHTKKELETEFNQNTQEMEELEETWEDIDEEIETYLDSL
jgi:predicted nuclease with TOPRIM domain